MIMEMRCSVITEGTCARPAIMADRTTLGPIRGAAAAAPGLRSDAPTAVPPPPRQRSDRVRQAAIADTTCSATTIRNRRDEWTRLGVFAQFTQIGLQSYDRIVELVLDQIAIDGSITKAPGSGEDAGRSPVDCGKQGLTRSSMTDSYDIPLGRVLAGANRHDCAARPHPGPAARPRAAARRHHRPPGRRLCLGQDPRRTVGPQTARPHRPQGQEDADPGKPAMARRPHARLAERLPTPCPLLRTSGHGHRRLLRPRGHNHHRP
ncbi:hypothetical protein OKW18_006678 [Streptomyces pratensis]|nr:hypothetical protein [Streptomyces pratensis]